MASVPMFSKPLRIYRGDTYEKQLTITQRDPNTGDLVPVDLRGYGNSWAAQLRPSEDSTVFIPFDVDTTDAATGILMLRLSSLATADIPSKGVWDVQVEDTTQNPVVVRTLLRGTFERIRDVTKV